MPVSDATARALEDELERSAVPALFEYIRIPNQSPLFDREWREKGHMERAVELLFGWAKEHLPVGSTLEVVRLDDRTPVIFIDVPASGGREGELCMADLLADHATRAQ